MEGVKTWIASLCAVTFIMSVVAAIAPKNSAGKVCSMLGSIILIFVLVSPLKQISSSEIFAIGRVYQSRIDERIQKSQIKCEEIENKIIEEKLSAYVLNKAKLDAGCEAYIEVEERVPVAASVIINDFSNKEKVSRVLEEDLGLSIEKQEIKLREE